MPHPIPILICGGCPELTNSLAILLSVRGHDVRQARTAEDVPLLTGWTPRLLLVTDHDNATAASAARKLCQRLTPRPFVAGFLAYGSDPGFRMEGVDRWLLLPVAVADLERLLDDAAGA